MYIDCVPHFQDQLMAGLPMESIEQLKTASPPETNAILLVLMMGDDRGVSTMIIFFWLF